MYQATQEKIYLKYHFGKMGELWDQFRNILESSLSVFN